MQNELDKLLSWAQLDDPSARAEAAHKLDAYINHLVVQDTLINLLMDNDQEVAFEAAKSLIKTKNISQYVHMVLHDEIKTFIIDTLIKNNTLPLETLFQSSPHQESLTQVMRAMDVKKMIHELAKLEEEKRTLWLEVLQEYILLEETYLKLNQIKKTALKLKNETFQNFVLQSIDKAYNKRFNTAKTYRANLYRGKKNGETEYFSSFEAAVDNEEYDSANDLIFMLTDTDRMLLYSQFLKHSETWQKDCLDLIGDGPPENFGWLIELVEKNNIWLAKHAALQISKIAETFWYALIWTEEEKTSVLKHYKKSNKWLNLILLY